MEGEKDLLAAPVFRIYIPALSSVKEGKSINKINMYILEDILGTC